MSYKPDPTNHNTDHFQYHAHSILELVESHSQAVPTSSLGMRPSLASSEARTKLGQGGTKTILDTYETLVLPLILFTKHPQITSYTTLILCTHNIKCQYSELLSLLSRQLAESDGASVVFVSCVSSSTVLSPSANLTPSPGFPQQQRGCLATRNLHRSLNVHMYRWFQNVNYISYLRLRSTGWKPVKCLLFM